MLTDSIHLLNDDAEFMSRPHLRPARLRPSIKCTTGNSVLRIGPVEDFLKFSPASWFEVVVNRTDKSWPVAIDRITSLKCTKSYTLDSNHTSSISSAKNSTFGGNVLWLNWAEIVDLDVHRRVLYSTIFGLGYNSGRMTSTVGISASVPIKGEHCSCHTARLRCLCRSHNCTLWGCIQNARWNKLRAVQYAARTSLRPRTNASSQSEGVFLEACVIKACRSPAPT